MSAFDDAARGLSLAAESNGMARMQVAVLHWLMANRGEIPQQAVDSLIAHMGRELAACEKSPQST